VPWERINDESIDSWAASHQQVKVNEFARRLKADQNSVHPSVLIQGHNGDKADIIDGHHRALAHRKLGQPVRAYLGTVTNPEDVKAALETHSSQFHAGTDPRNK
jgi:ParB-like chromosome segregation protein Spo0J